MDTGVLASLSTSVDALLSADPVSLTDAELLEVARQVEVLRRRLENFDHVVVPEVQRRNLAGAAGVRGPHRLLAGVWNLTVAQADQRVMHALALAPRVSLTGEQLAPLRPLVGAARAEGAFGREQTEAIVTGMRSLPSHLPVSDYAEAERILVDTARIADSRTVTAVARRLRDTIDPDGSYRDPDAQSRRRSLSLTDLPDGMVRIVGTLDAETGALARAAFGSLAAPVPAVDAAVDDRAPRERLHDALKAVCSLALRSGELASSGGTPASVVVTMTVEQFESRTGIAHTSTGQRISVPQAMRVAGEASIAWAAGGTTDLDNLVTLCRFHHDHHERLGWRIEFRDRVPWFIPPVWRDPDQTPLRNARTLNAG